MKGRAEGSAGFNPPSTGGRWPLVVATVLLFFTIMLVGLGVIRLDAAQRQASQDRITESYSVEIRSELEGELFRGSGLVRGLRAYVAAHPVIDDPDHLMPFLQSLYLQGNHVTRLTVAPAGGEARVYPEDGARTTSTPRSLTARVTAGGADPTTSLHTSSTGSATLVVSSLVSRPNRSYWGYVSVELDLDSLLASVRARTHDVPAAWGVHASTNGRIRYRGGSESAFLSDHTRTPTITDFEMNGTEWKLAVKPHVSADLRTRNVLLYGLVIVLAGFLSVIVFQARRSRRRIADLSLHDPLTGLPNRRLLDDHCEQVLAAARRTTGTFTILFIDLDSFKEINDRYGHRAGDHVLKIFGTRLRERMRATDTVARLGGDEFVVLLPNTDRSGSEAIIAEIGEILNKPIDWNGRGLTLEASIGTAEYPTDGSDIETLISRADSSMYQVKHERTRV